MVPLKLQTPQIFAIKWYCNCYGLHIKNIKKRLSRDLWTLPVTTERITVPIYRKKSIPWHPVTTNNHLEDNDSRILISTLNHCNFHRIITFCLRSHLHSLLVFTDPRILFSCCCKAFLQIARLTLPSPTWQRSVCFSVNIAKYCFYSLRKIIR